MWLLSVSGLTQSAWQIAGFRSPRQINCRTSDSRGVSLLLTQNALHRSPSSSGGNFLVEFSDAGVRAAPQAESPIAPPGNPQIAAIAPVGRLLLSS